MSRTFWSSLWLAPAILGATALTATASVPQSNEAQAQVIGSTLIADSSVEQTISSPSVSELQASANGEDTNAALDQVTSVSQLTDVRPTDWAFQALQSLVERYGCIVGYPDRTYRGNRALTRYEFAAGLNACMDRINELITAATADLVKREDLLVVQRLQEEFAAELATLRGQIDALEVRTATLERQQFSTTTKLRSEVIFALADTFGDETKFSNLTRRTRGNPALPFDPEDRTETIFGNRTRINFDTSFNGKDRLRTRLQAANITPFSGNNLNGTNMTRLGFDGGNNNVVDIDELWYRFPVGDKLRIQIDATNTEFYDGLVSSLSPLESSGSAAISRFGRFNPALRSPFQGAGVSFDYKFSDLLSLQGGYIADTNSNDPSPRNGLFNGGFSAIGQLVVRPSKSLDLGLFYTRSYYPGAEDNLGTRTNSGVNVTASTGSALAARPFGNEATAADTFGANLQYRFNPKLTVGGWFAYTSAHERRSSNDATVINWAAFLAFPDLFKEGNLGGLLVGMPPKLIDSDRTVVVGGRRIEAEDPDTSIHVEAFYRYRINDFISITPGFFVLFSPEHDARNATQFVGTVRTTFTF